MSATVVGSGPPPLPLVGEGPSGGGAGMVLRGPWTTLLTGAAGLALVAASFARSRGGHTGVPTYILFWGGYCVILGPIAVRLLAARPTRGERLGLAVIAGLLLYGVKVLHEPSMFLEPDEWIHLGVLQHLVATRSLFSTIGIPGFDIFVDYPGLETVTAAVSQVTGVSLFASGVIVLALARVIMVVALFLLVERVTKSARVAGVATLLYMGNGNFLFWSAQFSYESLALPLFVLALLVIVIRADEPEHARSLSVTVVILTVALVATHHVTAYLLAAILWVLSAMSRRRQWAGYRCRGPALVATGLAILWTVVVAPATESYLGFVARRTTSGVDGFLSSGAGRAPFSASVQTLQTPVAAELVGLAAVLVIAVGLLWSLWRLRRSTLLQSAPGILLALASIGFLSLYPLHLSSDSWETANRGQEILFIGAGTVLASLAIALVGRWRAHHRRAYALGAVAVLVLCSGVIDGTPAPVLLPLPLQVRAPGGATIVPQGMLAARWAVRTFGRRPAYAADEGSGRELVVAGALHTYVGSASGVPQLLHDPVLPAWEPAFIAARRIALVILDRRQVSSQDQEAYYFQPASDPSAGVGYYPAAAR
ncbi:MAG: hypothetical protein ABSH51_24030, partial [Solirubrobacteraceae bacterium]